MNLFTVCQTMHTDYVLKLDFKELLFSFLMKQMKIQSIESFSIWPSQISLRWEGIIIVSLNRMADLYMGTTIVLM